MEVKPGYKMTDIGYIPDNWEAKTIGDVTEFSGGSQPPKSTFRYSPKTGYLRLIQIRDYKTDDFETYIPEALARKRCLSSDIMIGRYGPPVFQIFRGIEGAYNVALIKATPKTLIDKEFLYHILRQEALFQVIDSLSRRSSGQTGVEMPALKAYKLPLPPLSEQRAIASALSDVDALLSGLDRLIAKKRDLKQAAMQQLLTGKTRLPGFSGEWEVKKLGVIPEDWEVLPLSHIFQFKQGVQIPVEHQSSIEKAGYLRFIRITDLTDPSEAWRYIPDPGSVHHIGPTDLFMVRYGSPGLLGFGHEGVIANNLFRLMPKREICPLFFRHYIKKMEVEIACLSDSSALPAVNFAALGILEVVYPPLTEQSAIAAVLSDMDAEIAALEARRDKTRDLKQAMMQELLTGRTRLV